MNLIVTCLLFFLGPKGVIGEEGFGEPGDSGDTGIKGEKGDRGGLGIPGDKGLKGLPGRVGNPGDKGFKGNFYYYLYTAKLSLKNLEYKLQNLKYETKMC